MLHFASSLYFCCLQNAHCQMFWLMIKRKCSWPVDLQQGSAVYPIKLHFALPCQQLAGVHHTAQRTLCTVLHCTELRCTALREVHALHYATLLMHSRDFDHLEVKRHIALKDLMIKGNLINRPIYLVTFNLLQSVHYGVSTVHATMPLMG